MPNHIINVISVNEGLEDIKKFVKTEGSEFNFNKIVPMPDELRNTQSPALIINEKKLKELKGNWRGQYSYRPISKKESKELIKKYGADNWYDWSIANWGAKWDAYDVVIDQKIEFQTAWTTPIPIILALSKQFPETKFTVEYADENMGQNCGVYEVRNNTILEEWDEGKDFACKLWGITEDED